MHTTDKLAFEALQQQYLALQEEHAALQADMRRLARRNVQQSAFHNQALLVQLRKQQKAETLQRVFYEIAERSSAGLRIFDFLQTVHHLLGALLYAKNCFVCMHDVDAGLRHYPYFVDERDTDRTERLNIPRGNGVTEFVLRTGVPQILDQARFWSLVESGEVTDPKGDVSFTAWLGVPMKINGVLKGVLVVQAYEPGVCYEPEDADVLSYVASLVGSAIERVRVLDALRRSEERNRRVIEAVGVGVAVFQNYQLVFANPKLVEVTGYSLEYLQQHAYTAVTQPETLGIQIECLPPSQRGQVIETRYRVRLVAADGEWRYLDVSTVEMVWEGQGATLVFLVDVTAREAAERIQKAAVQKQLDVAAMQSRFITMVSHEYRTPLTTIHGAVELLQHCGDRMTAQQKRDILQKMGAAEQRMTLMLDEVLVLGRSDAGELRFQPRPLAITPLCHQLLDEVRSSMSPSCNPVAWDLELPEPSQLYWLDEALLRHILGNLLSNAVKYSPHGGSVKLAVRMEGEQLELQVADQGIGIPADDLPQLFERFHRAENVGGIVGSGLGLSIVKDAVQCHGGRIVVESELQRGTRFTVTLPVRVPVAPGCAHAMP